MKVKAIIIALLLSIPFSVSAAEPDGASTTTVSCVTRQEVLDAIAVLTYKEDTSVTYAVCDPCTCQPGFGSSACLQYMADKTRSKEEREAAAVDVINRFSEVGLCQ